MTGSRYYFHKPILREIQTQTLACRSDTKPHSRRDTKGKQQMHLHHHFCQRQFLFDLSYILFMLIINDHVLPVISWDRSKQFLSVGSLQIILTHIIVNFIILRTCKAILMPKRFQLPNNIKCFHLEVWFAFHVRHVIACTGKAPEVGKEFKMPILI
jgi:hypothetical protein